MSNKKYSKEDLEKALEDIKNGFLTIYRASQVYKIPNQTLHDKISKKYKKQENAGAPTVLTSEEEQLLVQWVLHMTKIGFPVTKNQLLQSVAKLLLKLKRPNPFKNCVPGRNWYEAFLKRNPIITKRVCQVLTTARVNADEEEIKAWFGRVRKYFEENNSLDVLEDPSRIFNCDESAFYFNPKGEPVLARKGVKNVHCRSGNDEKENLTLSLGASAEGKLMPVLALFPDERLHQNILSKYPKDWIIGRTDSGWMTCESFYEYVANQFEPFLTRENIKRPVALFLNGHVSHLSLPLCEFCKEKKIILLALLPNATHALQPMDVAVFHSLKNAWSKEVYTWRMENNGRLKREDFGPVLEKAIRKTLRPEIIKNGFRKSGLFPFDENAVHYKKIPKSSAVSTSSGTSTPVSLVSAEDPHKLNELGECSGECTEMRYYTRKTKRGLVPAELMQAAAHEVLNRGASMKKTAKENNICSTTLFRFIRKIKSGETPTVGYKPRLLFSRDQEQEILKHLSEYAKVFCGLTLDDVRTFACQFAIRMKYTNIPRSWFKNGKASKDWADKFATRHQLPLKPMKEVIDINKCYSILHKVMERHKFLQSRIYHLVDMSIVTKVVKSKAYANGRVLMSVGQRKPVNVQFAANAEGETVPPMFVTDEYKATNVIKNSSGCMTVKDFPKYLNHFVKHTMPNEADPVLLLIDEQQYLDVNVLERARANSVILLSFPVSHNIQPLKKIANNILESCKAQVGTPRSTPDGECDILEIASKVIAEVRKSAIVKCFRKTGVWPFNPNVVTGEDFVPTAVKEYDFKISKKRNRKRKMASNHS